MPRHTECLDARDYCRQRAHTHARSHKSNMQHAFVQHSHSRRFDAAAGASAALILSAIFMNHTKLRSACANAMSVSTGNGANQKTTRENTGGGQLARASSPAVNRTRYDRRMCHSTANVASTLRARARHGQCQTLHSVARARRDGKHVHKDTRTSKQTSMHLCVPATYRAVKKLTAMQPLRVTSRLLPVQQNPRRPSFRAFTNGVETSCTRSTAM